ncbi:MAG: Choline-sulfatase [uncultured Thermomicrobiales bacterium]|uniref:Choline-sulfatase n=1 Tax=uncultured Thermomicrobiales bacterium TaxID=1645740 RepID=A0A6J4VQM8_9BACT|nr:MAG: Choline-sulfatase [uncultured Thermomicrobiales bacterium]
MGEGTSGSPGMTDLPRPNIVLIMTDQQRADFFKAEGFPFDTMPFVDALGAEGARFGRAYCPMPACAPSRASLLTGRYPKATRVRQNSGSGNLFAPTDLVRLLRERGYSINLAGKNHSFLRPEEFDAAAPYWHTGAEGGATSEAERRMDAWLHDLDHGVHSAPTPFPGGCQPAARIVRDAIACVDGRDERPFFLWLSFPEPHNPYQVPEPYFSMFPEEAFPERIAGPEAAWAKGGAWRWLRSTIERKRPTYDGRWRRYRANYCGMLRLIDDQIRRFVGHLEASGLREDTLIVFLADHGDYAGDYGLQRKGAGMPECLMRVPLVFNGPGVVPGASFREEFVSLVDVMPTLCEMLGVEAPYGVQGRSLWPLLSGQAYPAAEFRSVYAESGFGGLPYAEGDDPPLHFDKDGPSFDELNAFTQGGNTKMVRKGRWKLLYDVLGRGELYDLERDPAELDNRFGDPSLAAVRLELVEELLTWTIRTEDDLPSARYVPKRAERNWHAPYWDAAYPLLRPEVSHGVPTFGAAGRSQAKPSRPSRAEVPGVVPLGLPVRARN